MTRSITIYEQEILALLDLPETQRGRIFTALLCKYAEKELPELDPMEAAVFKLIAAQVKRAAELSEKRRQNVNSRWKSGTKDVQNDTNLYNGDTSPYTNTNTVTDTKTVTDTVTVPPLPPEGEADKSADTSARVPKKQSEKIRFAEFVSMTDEEYSSLAAELGEEGARRCVEILDNYKGESGKRYKNDYRAILNWVITRYKEEQSAKAARGERETREVQKEHSFDLDLLIQHALNNPPKLHNN